VDIGFLRALFSPQLSFVNKYMKYSININQLVLSETKLDLIECAILDYLYFYCNSTNEKIEKQRVRDERGTLTWINYQTLLKDMPLLKIKSSGALTPRIKKIEKEGFITTYRERNQKLFIKMNDKMDKLFIKTNRAIHENEQLPSKSCSRKRTNNNTIDNYKEDKGSSSKKPYFRGMQMCQTKKDGKWWVLPESGAWLEFAGKKKDIIWK